MTSAKIIRRYLTLAALSGIALMSACAGTSGSTPSILTNKDPAADFDRFKTFAFVEPLGTDRNGTRTSLSIMLSAAATRELLGHGLSPVSNSADLLVNFLTATESRVAHTGMSGPNASFHHGRTGYVTWNGYPVASSTTHVITEGSIAIDIVDAASNRLVWEGAATGRLTENMRDNLGETVDTVVAAILAEFP